MRHKQSPTPRAGCVDLPARTGRPLLIDLTEDGGFAVALAGIGLTGEVALARRGCGLLAGLLLNLQALLLGLLRFLRGQFVLLLGLLLCLQHLLQGELLLQLGFLLVLVVIPVGRDTAPDQCWWGLGELGARRAVGRCGHVNDSVY